MRPRWDYEFMFLTSILLFYLFPVNINRENFKFTLKVTGVVMTLTFLAFGTLLTVEKNFRSRYPVAVVSNDLNKIWNENFDTPLKYVGGYIEYSLPLTIYSDTHPINILDTYKYPNPWINEEDMLNSGAIVIDRSSEGVMNWVRQTIPYESSIKNLKAVPYKFIVKNALNMPREYTVHYIIIPPKKYWEK